MEKNTTIALLSIGIRKLPTSATKMPNISWLATRPAIAERSPMKTLATKAAEAPGLVHLRVPLAACPALHEMNRRIAYVVWHKDMREMREAASRVWQIREKYLEDLLDLALRDPATTPQEEEKLKALWKNIIYAAYPAG